MLCVSMDAYSPSQEHAHMGAPIAQGLLWGHSQEEDADNAGPGLLKKRTWTALCHNHAGKYKPLILGKIKFYYNQVSP